jgi:hypothetical protein
MSGLRFYIDKIHCISGLGFYIDKIHCIMSGLGFYIDKIHYIMSGLGFYIEKIHYIGDIMVSMLTSRNGRSWVKPKTMKLVFVVSPLSTQHQGERANTIWLGIQHILLAEVVASQDSFHCLNNQ